MHVVHITYDEVQIVRTCNCMYVHVQPIWQHWIPKWQDWPWFSAVSRLVESSFLHSAALGWFCVLVRTRPCPFWVGVLETLKQNVCYLYICDYTNFCLHPSIFPWKDHNFVVVWVLCLRILFSSVWCHNHWARCRTFQLWAEENIATVRLPNVSNNLNIFWNVLIKRRFQWPMKRMKNPFMVIMKAKSLLWKNHSLDTVTTKANQLMNLTM